MSKTTTPSPLAFRMRVAPGFSVGSPLLSPYTLPVWHTRVFTTPISSRQETYWLGRYLADADCVPVRAEE